MTKIVNIMQTVANTAKTQKKENTGWPLKYCLRNNAPIINDTKLISR